MIQGQIQKKIKITNLINSRTRAGYTCLHIAYIFKHGDLAPILKLYGAEGLIDYSGRQAIDYSKPQSFNMTDPVEIKANVSENSDPITLVKRSSSIQQKDKDLKESNNVGKFNKPRSSTLQRINATVLPPSPLAALEPCQNINSLTNNTNCSPVVIFRSRNKHTNNEDIYQNDENIESKENIYI